MNKVKSFLFWVTLLPCSIVMIAVGLLFSIPIYIGKGADWLCEHFFELFYMWEAWCLDYHKEAAKQGLFYRGGGIWSSIPKGFLDER